MVKPLLANLKPVDYQSGDLPPKEKKGSLPVPKSRLELLPKPAATKTITIPFLLCLMFVSGPLKTLVIADAICKHYQGQPVSIEFQAIADPLIARFKEKYESAKSNV